MNRKSQWSCLAVLVVLLLTTTMVAWSQPPDGQVTLKTFDDQIAEVQSAINDWDFRASLVRWLAFGIIALGALTTFIQTMNKPVIRAATAGLGLLVALGSGFKDFSFSGDPATLNASSTDARGLLADMRDKRRQYQRAQDVLQQDEINKQFLAKHVHCAVKVQFTLGYFQPGLRPGTASGLADQAAERSATDSESWEG